MRADLSLPDRVDGVADDTRSLLLTMVGESREDAMPSRVDRNLQIWVRIEEHPLLQTHGLDV